MNVITFFGKHQFLIPANLLLIAYYLFVRKHKWYSIKIPAIAISSLLLMFGLKHLFSRHRPTNQLLQEATNYSYPSGHALMSVTFYGLLAYIVWHTVKNKEAKWTIIVLLILWIFLIGISRIYLRRHYYSDVMAGFATGFLWLVISLKSIRQIEKRSIKKLNVIIQQPAPDIVVWGRTALKQHTCFVSVYSAFLYYKLFQKSIVTTGCCARFHVESHN